MQYPVTSFDSDAYILSCFRTSQRGGNIEKKGKGKDVFRRWRVPSKKYSQLLYKQRAFMKILIFPVKQAIIIQQTFCSTYEPFPSNPTCLSFWVLLNQIEIIINFITKKSEAMGCGASQEATKDVTLPNKDHYDRKDLIGVGNHGRVYRAVHLPTAKQYALKTIDQLPQQRKGLDSKEMTELVERLKKLKNTRITQYYEVEAREKQVVVVMEMAQEGTLKKLIQKNGKMTEEIVSKITLQILEGLSYLHTNSILHKDIKPSNILMLTENSIQLTDYALAQLYDGRLGKGDKTRPKKEDFSRGESLPYMAPQVIQGQGVTEKADVWALACTVIEMITGKLPWSELNPKFEKAFKEITAHALPPIPKEATNHCKNFLQRCLTIDPSKRASISELMKHPFITGKSQKKQQVDKIKVSLQKTDAANRISSRNSNSNKKQQQQQYKTPPSIEKTFKDQNSARYNNRLQSTPQNRSQNTSHNRLESAPQMEQSSESSHQLKRLKNAVNNFGKVKRSREVKAIHNEDILPQILEDQQDAVMLNNRKVKMKPHANKVRTEQTDQYHRHARPSIQLQNDSSSYSLSINAPPDRSRVQSKPSTTFNQSDIDSRVKLETEPILISGEGSKDQQYFKRPLKLLKKKLKQRQKNSRLAYLDESDHFPTQPQEHPHPHPTEQTVQNEGRVRTLSQQKRDEMAINTQLARAERDRYINEQLAMKRQREAEKAKWEEQLKEQSELIKKEFSHRYAYQRYHPVLNLM